MKIRVFTTYTTTSGVYIMLYTECMVSKRRKVDQSTIFVSFLNFWTYFMSEWAYKKRHVFKNIFKLPIPSYTSHSFLKHLNTLLTIRAILTMAYLYHQISGQSFSLLFFFISFTNICHLYMLAQILPVNKINRVQSN